MSEPNRALSQVPALLDERRKYESWLAALEARRESTPQRVFERVRDDYRRRLKRVEDQLASFRDALDAERADISGRLKDIREDEQTRLDERAELDLRVQVGELSAADASSAFRTLDDAVRQLASEREALEGKVAALERLLGNDATTLDAVPGPEPAERRGSAPEPRIYAPEPRTAAPEPRAAAPEPPISGPDPRERSPLGTFDELAFLSSVVEPGKPADALPATAAQPSAAAPSAPAPQPSSAAPRQPAPSQAAKAQDRDLGSLVPRDEGGASLLTGSTGNAGHATHEASASEALLDGLNSGTSTHRPETPPLSGKRQAPGATPLTMKAIATAEQPKTLKCTECGAMNYATEWYCERCGAELAAL
jgi:hypothetical protein